MSWKAVISMNEASNDQYHWIPVKIIAAEEQLVGSVKYTLNVLVARSNCTKKSVQYDEIRDAGCTANNTSKHQMCKVEIDSREWEGVMALVHRGCVEVNKNNLPRIKKDEFKLPYNNNSIKHTQQNLLQQNIETQIPRTDIRAWNMFNAFMERHNRTYSSKSELLKRFRIYKHNSKLVKDYQLHEEGTAVYGETIFSDMSQEEFKRIMLPYTWAITDDVNNIADLEEYSVNDVILPDSVDWRDKNTVTDVKNQGSCGSCWAFSVTGNIEGVWARKTGNLVSLSEQQLVDCDIVDHGCDGGLPANAYKEIVRLGGLELEKDYPYSGHNHKCNLSKPQIAVYINNSIELPHDEQQMAAWLAVKGPISIGECNSYILFCHNN